MAHYTGQAADERQGRMDIAYVGHHFGMLSAIHTESKEGNTELTRPPQGPLRDDELEEQFDSCRFRGASCPVPGSGSPLHAAANGRGHGWNVGADAARGRPVAPGGHQRPSLFGTLPTER